MHQKEKHDGVRQNKKRQQAALTNAVHGSGEERKKGSRLHTPQKHFDLYDKRVDNNSAAETE
jgi:hypothetical protein